MRRGIRAKGARERGITGILRAGPMALADRALRLAKLISAGMALKGIITGLAEIITAVREAARGRIIDLDGPKSRVRVSLRKPRLRMRSAVTRKNAESARRRIKNPGRTLSMRMRTQQ